jgi:hypothetical protein
MPTTTSYGTWETRVDDADTTVERTVINALADGMCGDTNTAAIVAAYRDAINAALPVSVELRGEEFFGPAGFEVVDFESDGYPVDEDGGLDIDAIVRAVDFWEIVKQIEGE